MCSDPSIDEIATAAGILRRGGLVAFPTETVYGLGADATNPAAVARIFQAKGRPAANPLIVHIPDLGAAEPLADFNPTARRLATAYWPGPLTLIVPRAAKSGLAPAVSAGLVTVAIRAPAHPVARRLLAAVRRPLAAPSANRSGQVSPTTAAHVRAGLGASVDLVLDGGPCRLGLESTVLDLTGDSPAILRPGALTAESLAEVLGPLAPPTAATLAKSPGTRHRHYAPRAKLRLNATAPGAGEAFLAFGPAAVPTATDVLNLSPAGDLAEAAANLYRMLLALDATGRDAIAVAPIPDHGLGVAINDRVRRAARR